jgi:hypothetical protein
MPTIAEIRSQYPQYNDLSDDALEDKLYKKFYSDMPRAEFYKRLSVNGVSSEIQNGGGDDLAFRSTILPLGKTKEGNIVPAVPGAIKSLIDLPEQFIKAGQAGPPGSREITAAAVAPAAETAMAASPSSPAAIGPAIREGASELINLARPAIQNTQELKTAAQASYKVAEDAGVKLKPEAFQQMVSEIVPELKKAGFDKDIQPKAAAALRRFQAEIESGASPSLSELDILRQVAGSAAKSIDSNERRIARIITGKMDDFIDRASEKEFTSDPERVAGAAVEVITPQGSKIFRGPIHSDAQEAAVNALGKENVTSVNTINGFVTSSGRFLNRTEASKLSNTVANLHSAHGAAPLSKDGGGPAAVSALKDARRLWARHSKADQIDQLFEKAANNSSNYSASGFENALRNQFRALANNPNRLRKFSADERAVIKNVVRGGKLQNAMVKLGKYSPAAGFFGGVVAGEIGIRAFQNPELLPLLAVPAVAAVAKYAATKVRTKSAEQLREMVQGGKQTAEYFKKRKALRSGIVTDTARLSQRPALLGGSSTLTNPPPDQNNL